MRAGRVALLVAIVASPTFAFADDPTPATATTGAPVTSPSALPTTTPTTTATTMPAANDPTAAAEAQPVLAQLKDDKALADALSSITQDPSITVSDAGARPLAQALMSEGVHQLQAQHYDQALANFLEAYGKFPSPKILLNVASTLRDMGRLADAANTYQRYLADPATGSERVAEVKDLLLRLDAQLTIVTVRVFPRGSDVSIDGGPFVAVGSSLFTRLRPGIHLVRLRNERANKQVSNNEVTINGFEGEQKEVPIAIQVDVTPDAVAPPTATPTTNTAPLPPLIVTDVPDHLEGWLITGTQYSAESGTGNERRVRAGYAGPEITAVMPHDVAHGAIAAPVVPEDDHINSGVAVQFIADASHADGALGVSFEYAANQRVDLELTYARSKNNRVSAGVRYRLLTGRVRPYLAGSIPAFELDDSAIFGVRGAGGIELRLTHNLSVQGELGYEHFFESKVSTTSPYYTNLFVPIVGLIGRI